MKEQTAPFLLLFRNAGPETYRHLSPEERQRYLSRWNDWLGALVQQGKAIEGQPLEMTGRMVSGAAGSRVVDGPFVEAKEAIAGYVKLHVSGLEEATELARQHPGLAYGMVIEVRPAEGACELGVNALSPSKTAVATA